MNDFAVLISQHLEFDMPRMLEKLLDVDVWRAKRLLRLAPRRFVGVQELFLFADHSHAAPAAARGGFNNERKANALSFLSKLLLALHDTFAAGHRGYSEGLHFPARAVLFAHHLNDFGRRPDKGDFRGFADLRKVGVFGEKPVAGV